MPLAATLAELEAEATISRVRSALLAHQHEATLGAGAHGAPPPFQEFVAAVVATLHVALPAHHEVLVRAVEMGDGGEAVDAVLQQRIDALRSAAAHAAPFSEPAARAAPSHSFAPIGLTMYAARSLVESLHPSDGAKDERASAVAERMLGGKERGWSHSTLRTAVALIASGRHSQDAHAAESRRTIVTDESRRLMIAESMRASTANPHEFHLEPRPSVRRCSVARASVRGDEAAATPPHRPTLGVRQLARLPGRWKAAEVHPSTDSETRPRTTESRDISHSIGAVLTTGVAKVAKCLEDPFFDSGNRSSLPSSTSNASLPQVSHGYCATSHDTQSMLAHTSFHPCPHARSLAFSLASFL
ncbi:hypothetical protein AB1Y20_005356 [Prymnesium parvum]|uniref:Uncharacterized protein n=1 Tax=Prymnesium parvum TaxID=97485 RepID=A0AB34J6A5_PRYPA